MPACEWDTPDEKCQEDAIVKISMQFSDFYVCVEHYTELKRIYPPIMEFPMQLITEVLGSE